MYLYIHMYMCAGLYMYMNIHTETVFSSSGNSPFLRGGRWWKGECKICTKALVVGGRQGNHNDLGQSTACAGT